MAESYETECVNFYSKTDKCLEQYTKIITWFCVGSDMDSLFFCPLSLKFYIPNMLVIE